MKFSDKLIKLRKEKLLSQEELGEKLNVTRQTVSKWELGQTTPDMEKLVEMAKLFGVSLDELTSESELNINETMEEKTQTKRNIIIIVLLIIILFGAFAIIITKSLGIGFEIFKSILDRHKTVREQIQNQFGNMQGQISEQYNSVQDQMEDFDIMFGDIKEQYNSSQNEQDKKSFNRTFEIRGGTKSGPAVQWLIDDVIQNNQTNDRMVTVKYNDTENTDPAELRTLKRNFDNAFDKFEVYFEYGEDGYIYEAIIEKI